MSKHQRMRALSAPTFPSDLHLQLLDRIKQLTDSPKRDYLLREMLSKYVTLDADQALQRKSAAIAKWLNIEVTNEVTNLRLLTTDPEYCILGAVTFETFINWCRDYCSSIIGDTPSLESVIGSFSGGASTSHPRTCSHPGSKYLGETHITRRAMDYFQLIEPEMESWFFERVEPTSGIGPFLIKRRAGVQSVTVVPGNMMFTVPKNSDIDRVAAKEPDLNMFMQKGIGNDFRRFLRRININLNDQSINSSFAHRGSVTGSIATLDMSSASDSVTESLVGLILPEVWYTLLDAVRCHVTIIDGVEHRNEMFSSMGNGFTFELETLLFLVITRAVAYFTGTRGPISVYGDDIICPAGIVPTLIDVLSFLGFKVNPEKSFWEGPFRESCGGHYYNGLDITPFYIKGPIQEWEDIIHLANQLRKWCVIHPDFPILDPETEEIWLWIKGMVPQCLWGGVDTSFKYQLVSRDTPELRLQEKKRTRDAGEGAYIHWLNATWARTNPGDGIETSSLSQSTKQIEVKKVRRPGIPRSAVARPSHMFIHEQCE